MNSRWADSAGGNGNLADGTIMVQDFSIPPCALSFHAMNWRATTDDDEHYVYAIALQ
jgi:hypothetical protein